MKNFIHIVKPQSNSAELNIVPGTNVAEQSNPQFLFKTQNRRVAKVFLSFLLLCCITVQSIGHPFLEGGMADSIIVIEGDILRTDSGDVNDPVAQIEISDSSATQVYDEKACLAPVCETDVSQLSPGSYFVTFTTSGGIVHSKWVTKL